MSPEDLKAYAPPAEDEVLIVFTSGPNEPMPFSGTSTVRDKCRYQKIKHEDPDVQCDALIKSYRRKAAVKKNPQVRGVFTLAEYKAAISGKKAEKSAEPKSEGN